MSRPFAGEEDYRRIRSLLIDAFSLDGFGTWCTAGDLDWWRFTADDPGAIADVQLWTDATGGVMGFAWTTHGQIALVVRQG